MPLCKIHIWKFKPNCLGEKAIRKPLFIIKYKAANIKGDMSDSVTNYNYVGNTKVSLSIKKTNANKCTFSEIFLNEILKSFSVF